MAGCVYFVPGYTGSMVAQELIDRWGLRYAFDGDVTACPVSHGPAGRSGVIIADESRVPINCVGYYPDRQHWQPMKENSARCWVGMMTDAKPTPANVAKRKQLEHSKPVELGDGNQWYVPIAMSWSEEQGQPVYTICLDRQLSWHGGTQWTPGDIIPDQSHLWTNAEQAWDALLNSGETFRMDFRWVIDSLAANYVIGPDEISMLGLLHSNGAEAFAIIKTLIDYETYVERRLKKNAIAIGIDTGGG